MLAGKVMEIDTRKRQPRDPKTGRFIKNWEGSTSVRIYGASKPSGYRRSRAWLSHNRLAIVGYTAYVLLCFIAGGFGGYLGVSLGLK